jgi:hypothetical protein
MATLEVSNNQLQLIQKALDLYSRIGIGQFEVIKEHPTFEKHLHKEFSLGSGPFEVGNQTTRGEIVEIGPKGKWIKTKGTWAYGEEIKKWADVDNIEYTTDYTRYHSVRDSIDTMLVQPRNMLMQEPTHPRNGSWGIHNPKVDETCREAYDIIQVIRHEFWKQDKTRSNITVDSNVMLRTKDSDKIKVTL